MAYLRRRRLLELASLDRPWVGELFMRRKGGPKAEPVEHWNAEFERGGYDRLHRSEQRHHHRLLAALIAERHPGGAVLDIGCGEGVFYDSLRLTAPGRYLGVDVSDVAVGRAAARWPAGAGGSPRFVTGDGSKFETDERFDAIVFPECLEYLGEPEPLLAHYAGLLKPGGVFGVTQWMGLKALRLWRRVRDATEVLDEAVVMAPWGGAWQVWVCAPKKT